MMTRKICLILGFSMLLSTIAPVAQARPVNPPAQLKQPVAVGQRDNSITAQFLGVTPPLRDMAPDVVAPSTGVPIEIANLPRPQLPANTSQGLPASDTALQTEYFTPSTVSVLQNFAGTARVENVYPPDPSMDVGPNHVISLVNLHFQIFNKSGTSLLGPFLTNSLWTTAGTQCNIQNDGDGVVLYDQLADRWLIGQFAVTNGASAGYYYCLAISQTSDPTGAWYQYAIVFPQFPDYPKIGIWPDGYYFSANNYNNGGKWQGTEACAFERSAMLTGAAFTPQCWTNGTSSYFSLLPADLDGTTLPASGEPEHFAWNSSTSSYQILDMHIDWTNQANSTFTSAKTLTVTSFNQLCAGTQSCIPQPGTTDTLDGIGDRIMFRLPYRAFAGYSSMVLNNTAQVGTSPNRAGIRWYEFRNSGTPYSPANWTVYQQSTYDPGGSLSRWMGSIAMNVYGDIALGYSTSSGSSFPSISFTGRLHSDALNSMTLGETQIQAGAASQTAGTTPYRWGDYTQMAVDPVDDCTFWYTNEYLTSGATYWDATRIASFQLDPAACTPTAVVIEDLRVKPSMGAVVLDWQTATEINLLGFKLYRALEPDGDMQAIQEGLLPAQNPGQMVGASYEYVDSNINQGDTYAYKLRVFTTDGMFQDFDIGTVMVGWELAIPFIER